MWRIWSVGVALIGLNSWVIADDDGWVSLFDGKSLAGWHKNAKRIGHGTGGQWQVEDGVITGRQDPPGSGNGGILLTDKTFGDLEVTVDAKPDWGIDSGFFVRSTEQGQCYQFMVDYHEGGNVGHLYGEGTGGFNNRPFDIFGKYDDRKQLAALFTKPVAAKPPKATTISGEDWAKAWKVNDWNTFKVRCVGNPARITTWINGVLVSEFDGRTYDGPGYDRDKVAKLLGAEGRLALQIHGGATWWPKDAACRWKNIKVRPVKAE